VRLLSRIEEIILLAVWRLKDNAYGVTIREEVIRVTDQDWQQGAIYGPLARLHRKGYLTTTKGEPTPERGGRSKIFYKLTPFGLEALQEAQKIQELIWVDVPPLEFEAP
jgi:DNA-binding PadR family transcriptional regulator